MVEKYLRRCSPPPAIKEMHIKTTVRCNFMSIRLAKIRKSDNTKFLVCR